VWDLTLAPGGSVHGKHDFLMSSDFLMSKLLISVYITAAMMLACCGCQCARRVASGDEGHHAHGGRHRRAESAALLAVDQLIGM
jgi:hypothetical protein